MAVFYDYYFKICGKSNGNEVLLHSTITNVYEDDFYNALTRVIKLARPNAETITSIEYLGKKEYIV
ncbi:MAG: hypothetical protein MJZ20_10955 [Bacteroidaceae bacterium]|nr:hypothetical protein [Bacteroidaceae bacterium]